MLESVRRITPITLPIDKVQGSRRRVVLAAGGLISRRAEGGAVEVLIIHRPHRQDWTFPKGKVEDGETWEACALREVEEETGLRCRLEGELPPTTHLDHKGRLKVVRYWAMSPVGGAARPRNEVDAVRWVHLDLAARMLTYEQDRALLETFRGLRLSRSGRHFVSRSGSALASGPR
jgi:8-oxo-dGTP diphosphatase